MHPKVTVIIVNWNGGRFIDQCLSALLAQTVVPHEILLVDNASSDSSLDIVSRFPSVRVLPQNTNLGFARANNLAIQVSDADSEWIGLLNPDAFPEPSWLEALLSTACAYGDFDIFGSRLLNAADPDRIDGAGDTYHISGLVWRMGHGVTVGALSPQPSEAFSPCAAAALYRRRALLEVGGFDEDYFCYVEDVDIGFRLRLAGYRCLSVPASLARHVGSGMTGGRHSDFAVYHGHRNLVWTYMKDMPGVLFWLLLPLHVAMNLVTIVVFTLRGQGRIVWRAKLDAIKGLPTMWRKRQLVQSSRIATAYEIWRMMDKHVIPLR
ncbi:MAG: glycosyltransferase family 2 protein [Nitrospira sp.]|nr:glycosyltransferase family 2 protein [Nitrospira sp.]